MQRLSNKQLVFISFMLFSMFFGAGNLIFPAFLGRASGTETWISMAGFIISAVGLPILGVIAVAKLGGLDVIGGRVSPLFSILFPVIIYISIGPLMAIPRCATVAFEMGVKPYMSSDEGMLGIALIIYSIVFFCIVLWLSLSPSKLVDRFGKLLTPTLLVLILIILIKSIVTPLGGTTSPTEAYSEGPFFKGFLDGYLTMDLLASLAFGIVIANTIRTQGITNKRSISFSMMVAGLGAGALLAIIYSILGFLGASSGAAFGETDNGASVLTQVMEQLFGNGGIILLGAIFTIACLCVSIGLVISCSEYFTNLIPRLSYKQWAIVLTVLSGLIANMGLNAILSFSVPVLGMIYPIAVVLILLVFMDDLINSSRVVYVLGISLTAIFSILDTLNNTLLDKKITNLLQIMPFYELGIGWILPGIVGIIIGLIIHKFTHKPTEA
ncbi:branched-chain amino acid transport system II carrier protein [Bacillus massiliigorillae]|uniref:branched-chain amino acid transport system II carrier protein n=1 Tax=Bacillus massiliigorillae TaxID=1243664 RepID=UPI0003A6308D|nr:branched-chain amino acid transport system II carrier protein [Bacillus massiliigorillae]